MNKNEIVDQTRLAFDYIQKLYLETSYFIKEVEGLLGKEDEEFIIGRPGGYAITTSRSSGLESNNVELWLLRRMAVFFVPKDLTVEKAGQTITKFDNKIKVIYLRVVLDSKNQSEPKVFAGILYNFKGMGKTSMEKIEQLMAYMEYREPQVFKNPHVIDYSDGYLSFHGKLFIQNLFDLNSSEEIYDKIVIPAVELFRKSD
ncbi:MAG: hypothetical protein ABSE95_15020 [Thermodesulfobacteriota bacterium]|jgi:hypothetical protein